MVEKENIENNNSEKNNCNCDCNCCKDNNCDCNNDCNCNCDCCNDNQYNCECNCNEVNKEISDLREQVKFERDKYVRTIAEFENFRKRVKKEQIEFIEMAEIRLVSELLSILNDFDLALEVDKDNQGIKLINDKFKNILEKVGVKRIETKIGDDFDENFHEAISKEKVDNKEKDNKITKIVEYGYMMRSKIIRYAKVIVGSYEN